jgi:SAM-dependent methyltransferase
MIVAYDDVENFPGWTLAEEYFRALIDQHACGRIFEVGSGANPTLSPQFVRAGGLSYVTSDVSPEELMKADSAFEQLILDLTSENIDPALTGRFDCVLSRMVGEHIKNGRQYHENIYKLLRPGGIAVHCFSTLWAFPFAANHVLPEALTGILLNAISPRDEHRNAKFKAYYSWSRGPSSSMIRRFQNVGFEIVSYTGYFGHGYYRRRLPWLDRLEKQKSKLLLRHPLPQLCSYATVVLRKPS